MSLHLEREGTEMTELVSETSSGGESLYIMSDGGIVALSDTAINMITEMGEVAMTEKQTDEQTVLLAGAGVETLIVDRNLEVDNDTPIKVDDLIEVITSFKCKGCDQVFSERDDVVGHIEDFHLPPPVPSTDSMDEVDATPDHNVTGLSIVVTDENDRSDQSSSKPTHYRVFDERENREMLVCGQCSSCFGNESDLVDHLSQLSCAEQDVTPSVKVDKIETIVGTIVSIESDVNDNNVSEDVCEEIPNDNDPLSDSSETLEVDHHLRTIPCPIKQCHVRFKSEERLKYHLGCHLSSQQDMEGASSGSGFRCPECQQEKVFEKWRDLATHLWKIHSVDCDMLQCSLCRSYRTMIPKMLKAHNQTHRNLKKYKCDVCLKRFNQISQLKNHAVIHLDKNLSELPSWAKPKQCDICHKMFSDSKSLKKHVQAIHSQLKPYICQVCGHQSARKAMLQLHVRQHTGEKPFECDQCDYRTGDHNSLRRHKRRHTGDKPYKCPYCQYAAIQSSSFKSHMKSKHPEKPQMKSVGGVVLVGLERDQKGQISSVTSVRDSQGTELLNRPGPFVSGHIS